MSTPDHVYITIVRWPAGSSVGEQAAALASATGLDAPTARQRIAKSPPLIVHRVSASQAPGVMAVLKSHRVAALAVPERTMQAVPRPIILKSLAPALGAPEPMFLAEPWRSEPRGIRAEEFFLLVRAKIQALIRGETQTDSQVQVAFVPGVGLAPVATSETYRYDRSQRTEVIDLYLRDGTAYRIAGSKFNFSSLGSDRGYSDNENADKLACVLAEASPGCFIDTDFESFGCPTAYYHNWRSTLKAKEIRSDEAAFDFYSPWRFLLTKALAKHAE